MGRFLVLLKDYLVEILPALALGFFLSGLIHEFIPAGWVERNLGKKGIKSIFYATITGTLLPICCWGTLPIAVSLYKKGSGLGPTLAFLVATPATSISALLVTYKLLGLKFAIFIFLAVIMLGIFIGLIGNHLTFVPKEDKEESCPHCDQKTPHDHKRSLSRRMRSIFKFAFYDMPKDIGPSILLGILSAAVVETFIPIGLWIKHNLDGFRGYIFSLVVGLLMYICATATVPLADALIKQGLSLGAGMVFLLAGPVTSYGTILVLKKEFGTKILLVYLLSVSIGSLTLGYLFSFL